MRNTEHHRIAPRLRRPRRPAPSRQSAASALADLLEQPRFEVLPTPGAADLFATHLPPGRLLTVTASPNRGLGATLDVSVELAGLGFEVVPHLAARMVRTAPTWPRSSPGSSRKASPGSSSRAATPPSPARYPDAVALLEALDAMGSPFASVGITGYPESHPTIPDDLTVQAMWDKRRYATEMVSNLTFDPQVVETWLARVRTRGVTLPLWLGIPGHVDTARLLAVATRIGVGDSAPVPAQAAAHGRPAGLPRRLRHRAVPARGSPPRWPATSRSSPGSTSSPSTRSPRPRPGAPACSRSSGREVPTHARPPRDRRPNS